MINGNVRQVSVCNHFGRILNFVFVSSSIDASLSRVDLFHYRLEIVVSSDFAEPIECDQSFNEFNFKK